MDEDEDAQCKTVKQVLFIVLFARDGCWEGGSVGGNMWVLAFLCIVGGHRGGRDFLVPCWMRLSCCAEFPRRI